MRSGRALPWLALATGLAGLIVLAAGRWEVPLSWQVTLLAAGVTLLGLPHGALDPLVARRAGLWRGRLGLLGFLSAYLIMAAIALATWIVLPGPSLALFLVLSAWHFSGDWREHLRPTLRVGAGAALIALPALFHPLGAGQLFAYLVPSDAAAVITMGLTLVAPVALAALLIGAIAVAGVHPRTTAELLLIAGGAAVLPPLLFFVAYFCLLHSPRHLLRAARGLPLASTVTTGVLLTALAAGAGALAFLALPGLTALDGLVRVVFIGLAVLTVPHMILIETWAARHREGSGDTPRSAAAA